VTEPVPNLALQVSTYLSHHQPGRNTLYVLWSGANNLLVGGKVGVAAATSGAGAVKRAMQTLESAGARQLLVLAMPELGDTPRAQAGGAAREAAATEFAVVYNRVLKAGIVALRMDPLFDAKIFEVGIYSELKLVCDTVKAGQPYQPDFFVPGPPVTITNVTDQGLEFFRASGKMPTGYLFWDDVHPTTEGHRLIAGLAIRAVGEGRSNTTQSP
jgi:outer membrane lipase/esterase